MVQAITTRQVLVPARDGFQLAATVFEPRNWTRVAVMNSATAVPRGFYKHYAKALAESGILAITYDYRGIGGSRPKSLRGFQAQTRDWALKDMSGVVDWATEEMKPGKLFMIGHSVGGQVTGLIDNADKVDGMLTYSSQSGHWRLQVAEQKWVVGFHAWVTLPVSAMIMGYMPWSWAGGAEDLPKGAALEWSRWSRHPDYLLGDPTLPLERFESFSAPVLAYSIDDDKWGSAQAVDAMMKAYPNLERRHLVPSEHNLDRVGHMGFFRRSSSGLWQEGIDWLHEQ